MTTLRSRDRYFSWTTMPSQFVCQFTKPLIYSFVFKPPSPLPEESTTDALSSSDPSKKHALHALLVSLNDTPTITYSIVANTVTSLRSLDIPTVLSADDPEEEALKHAIVTKLIVAVYAEALDTYLTQATEVEAEAEWWADIERSRLNVTWYLLQSLFAQLKRCSLIIGTSSFTRPPPKCCTHHRSNRSSQRLAVAIINSFACVLAQTLSKSKFIAPFGPSHCFLSPATLHHLFRIYHLSENRSFIHNKASPLIRHATYFPCATRM